EPEPIELEPIVHDVVERYRRTCSHAIEFRRRGELPPLTADPVRLGQVVENLISNACKYSGEGAAIDVLLEDRTDKVRIVVSDDGAGIEPSDLERIFERFHRVKKDEANAKGTGLGLYITKQIVEMHGGTIEVESQPGEGTTFAIEIPIRLEV
ncbi:MAG: ATP-binding protein, partial [Thermoanaerobaculia bacterium]|nr:ATP-binding protein [Thermoanaerobaculia bacterium]